MIQQIYEFASNRNHWMVAVFVFYVANILLIGVIYYFLSLSNKNAFLFNSDIVRAQSAAVELSMNQRLAQLTSELGHLRLLKDVLRTMDKWPTIGLEFGGLFITSTITGSNAIYTVVWPKARGGFPGGGEAPPTNLRVSSIDGNSQIRIVGESYYNLPQTIAEFGKLTDRWIADWEAAQKQNMSVITSIKTDSPKIWSYWDYLYFSAVTQFTVGYGDILPNSTPVRLIVVLQTCISAALLIVVINLAFAGAKP